jgi:hypothetical protein
MVHLRDGGPVRTKCIDTSTMTKIVGCMEFLKRTWRFPDKGMVHCYGYWVWRGAPTDGLQHFFFGLSSG